MKNKIIAVCCAMSMVLGINAYADNIDVEEELAPEFCVVIDGEYAEEATDDQSEDEEAVENENQLNESTENSAEEDTSSESETDNVDFEAEDIASDEESEIISDENDTLEYVEADIEEMSYSAEVFHAAEVFNVDISVDAEAKSAEIIIDGANITDRLVSVKIAPLGGYSALYYIRNVKLDSDIGIIYAMLPSDADGLCKVDVDMAELGHWSKIAVIGESENLTCVSNRKTAVISGNSKTAGIKSVQIKVMDENGEVVFLRQKNSNADGSFELRATLPAESPTYVVWVTVSGENGGYAKTITPYNSSEAKYTYEFASSGGVGEYTDVAIYGKNITDKTKYVYELDYSSSADVLTLVDACGFTGNKELAAGFCENTDIEIISVSNGKIRFVVNSSVEENKLWAGTLNLIRFKRNGQGTVNFTLRIYE